MVDPVFSHDKAISSENAVIKVYIVSVAAKEQEEQAL